AVLDPATVPGGYTFERFREELAARLHLLPPFRKRLVDVPLGVHDPMWLEDADFDIDRHIRRERALKPGGSREMDQIISSIASTPLARDRPLWETTVIEDLADGRIGFVTKVHHAVADGVAAAELLANVTSADPGDETGPVPDSDAVASGWEGEPMPGRLALFTVGLRERLRQILAFPALLWRTFRNLFAVARRRRAPGVNPPRPVIDAPVTPFNRSLTPARSFATVSLDLDRLRAVKAQAGVTLNDVLLASVTGALRSYLAERDQLPDSPLVAGVPVSTDRPDDVRRLGGNKVSNMFTGLPVEEPDPGRRLRRISEVTDEAKVVQNLLGADMLADWSDFTGRPYGWVMRQYSRSRVADRGRPMINLVVSNVPGPREHLYVAGARIEDIFSVGPIVESVGLNITAWSYAGQRVVEAVGEVVQVPDVV
ncbi:MAG: wax ester/triacylglycerol synthase family O-acyltransferase, partial [Actinomycetota bacterium]